MKLKSVKKSNDKIVLISEDNTIYNCRMDKLSTLIEQAERELNTLIDDYKNNNYIDELNSLRQDHMEYFQKDPCDVYDIYKNDKLIKTMHFDKDGKFLKMINIDGTLDAHANGEKQVNMRGNTYNLETGKVATKDELLFADDKFEVYTFDDIIYTGFKIIENDNEYYFTDYGNDYVLCQANYFIDNELSNIRCNYDSFRNSKITVEYYVQHDDIIDIVRRIFVLSKFDNKYINMENYITISGIGMFIKEAEDENYNIKYLPRLNKLQVVK